MRYSAKYAFKGNIKSKIFQIFILYKKIVDMLTFHTAELF